MKLTDFLDPREQFITESVIQHADELGIMFLAVMRERSAKERSFIPNIYNRLLRMLSSLIFR